jgi:hypothetical protein
LKKIGAKAGTENEKGRTPFRILPFNNSVNLVITRRTMG